MPDRSFLEWPFFDGEHRALARNLDDWAATEIAPLEAAADRDQSVAAPTAVAGAPGADVPAGAAALDAACRELVGRLGAGGWLRYAVPAGYGGFHPRLDARSLCLIRETLARHSGLADFAFAMQGLGSAPITLFGSEALKERYLPAVGEGRAIAAFAISEAEAGSDLSALATTARREADGSFRIDGEKTWISNAGLADHYVVFCRFPEAGEGKFAAFIVDARNPGLRVTERLTLSAPHPIGTLALEGCRVPAGALIGEGGDGLKVALATLDLFRPSVGAAALGMARRAFDEAVSWTKSRHTFGRRLADHQMTRAQLAEMATSIDAAALLVYRAAWRRDTGASRITREAAMAKLFATEAAQQVVDGAVQLLGGRGVVAGSVVERLYREVRALRIYEGTSEIQKIIIAGQVLSPTDGGSHEPS